MLQAAQLISSKIENECIEYFIAETLLNDRTGLNKIKLSSMY